MHPLSERLRDRAKWMMTVDDRQMVREAADELDRLTAENARLRRLLEEMVDGVSYVEGEGRRASFGLRMPFASAYRAACQALEQS